MNTKWSQKQVEKERYTEAPTKRETVRRYVRDNLDELGGYSVMDIVEEIDEIVDYDLRYNTVHTVLRKSDFGENIVWNESIYRGGAVQIDADKSKLPKDLE